MAPLVDMPVSGKRWLNFFLREVADPHKADIRGRTRDERDGASSCWQYWADSARKYFYFGNGESAKTKPTPLVPASSYSA